MEKDSKNNLFNDWRELLLYLGYNICSEEDIARLTSTVHWVENQMLNHNKYKNIRASIIVVLFSTVIGAVATVLVDFLVGHKW